MIAELSCNKGLQEYSYCYLYSLAFIVLQEHHYFGPSGGSRYHLLKHLRQVRGIDPYSEA